MKIKVRIELVSDDGKKGTIFENGETLHSIGYAKQSMAALITTTIEVLSGLCRPFASWSVLAQTVQTVVEYEQEHSQEIKVNGETTSARVTHFSN